MHEIYGLSVDEMLRGGIVAIGNFDGVHRGHQAMIAETVRLAREQAVAAVAMTFHPHPAAVLRGAAPPALCTLRQKLDLLAHTGLDGTIVCPTDRAFLNLTPREFFEQIVQGRLAARGLVEGPNFRFGRNREGDVQTLATLCHEAGLLFRPAPAVQVGDLTVSSSEIRRWVAGGELPSANALLGRPYRIRGTVVEGAQRGRSLGFPTANLTEIETLLPPDGVYAGQAWIAGQGFPAGINVGANPTFAETRKKVEIHLLDFTGDLYGQSLDVDLLMRLRETRAFSGVEELTAQLAADMRRVREYVEHLPHP